MTRNWLEFDQKFFTMKNLIFCTRPKFMTPTNINFTPKNMLVPLAWTGLPALASSSHWLGHLPSLLAPRHCSSTQKTSGTEVRRTPDVKLRFVGFNFGHFQLLRFVVVIIQSYSFDHLGSVKQLQLLSFKQNIKIIDSSLR